MFLSETRFELVYHLNIIKFASRKKFKLNNLTSNYIFILQTKIIINYRYYNGHKRTICNMLIMILKCGIYIIINKIILIFFNTI